MHVNRLDLPKSLGGFELMPCCCEIGAIAVVTRARCARLAEAFFLCLRITRTDPRRCAWNVPAASLQSWSRLSETDYTIATMEKALGSRQTRNPRLRAAKSRDSTGWRNRASVLNPQLQEEVPKW